MTTTRGTPLLAFAVAELYSLESAPAVGLVSSVRRCPFSPPRSLPSRSITSPPERLKHLRGNGGLPLTYHVSRESRRHQEQEAQRCA